MRKLASTFLSTPSTELSARANWVDDDIKEQATVALTAMGLTVSDAVRLFLRRVVVEQAFPLELKVPNAQSSRHGRIARHDGQPTQR